jgi:hypothetical protein
MSVPSSDRAMYALEHRLDKRMMCAPRNATHANAHPGYAFSSPHEYSVPSHRRQENDKMLYKGIPGALYVCVQKKLSCDHVIIH